jgi:hypothetical protein
MFEPCTTVAGADLEIETSAEVLTVVDAVEVLSVKSDSIRSEVTLAVLLITVPEETPAPTFTVRLNVAVPGAIDAEVQVTVPVPPTEGVEHDSEGPPVWLSETNVVPAGSVSVMDTFGELLGPWFSRLRLYNMLAPALTVAGADFVIVSSAIALTVTDAEELLLAGMGSAVVEEIVAVLVMIVPSGTVGLTLNVKVKVASAAFAIDASVQVRVPELKPQLNAGPVG